MIRTIPFLLFTLSYPGGILFAQDEESARQEWQRTSRNATVQHELIMVLIDQNRFDQVLAETAKIFSSSFPRDKEHLLVEEAQIINNHLIRHTRYGLAHQVLDQALQSARTESAKAELFREKAYVCKKEGDSEKAMEMLTQALQLESEAEKAKKNENGQNRPR